MPKKHLWKIYLQAFIVACGVLLAAVFTAGVSALLGVILSGLLGTVFGAELFPQLLLLVFTLLGILFFGYSFITSMGKTGQPNPLTYLACADGLVGFSIGVGFVMHWGVSWTVAGFSLLVSQVPLCILTMFFVVFGVAQMRRSFEQNLKSPESTEER